MQQWLLAKNGTCHRCGNKGHIRPNCPSIKINKDNTDNDITNKEKKKARNFFLEKKWNSRIFQFVQYKDNEIFDDDNHSFEKLGFYDIGDLHELYLIILFLLDNQSTVDLFWDKKIVAEFGQQMSPQQLS